MTQDFIIFATIELFALCLFLYLIIRMNIYVNTLQHEVNELYFQLPIAIRDLRDDVKEFNRNIVEKVNVSAFSEQDIGFLAGRISAELLFSRFNVFSPFRKNFLIVSLLFKVWKLRDKLKATFLKYYLS